ncbi:MAG TPA: iron ABC transporter permease [Ignavibacteria bacterium]|nr:iron ABC transporter permease [Ignavibacteria bacterium]HMR40046.1 iron ABC transporter permease [Ignavibacteria bacterium]
MIRPDKNSLFKLSKLNIFLLAVIIFFITGYILYPLYSLVKDSMAVFSSGSETGSFYSIAGSSVLNSVLLSLITAAGSFITGLFFAYIFHFKKLPFGNFLYSILLIPIAAPPLVSTVAFLFLLNENGLLIRIITMLTGIESIPFKFDGWTAIIIIHIYSFYPFFLLFIYSALKKIDFSIIEASYSLGASKIRTFFRIIFPQLIPSVTGASLIVFMASMASFTAPLIFGGSIRFLTTEIYSSKINGDSSAASMLSVLLTLISLLFFLMLRYYRSRNSFETRTKGTVKTFVSDSNSKAGILTNLTVYTFITVILLPILALGFLSLIPEGSLMRNYFTEPFSLENYSKVFKDPKFFEPFINSVKMAVIAVVITIIVGVSASFLISRKKIRGGKIIEGLLSLPYGIPGTVIALSFIISFNTPNLFSGFIPLTGTFWILPLAYAVRNMPIITQSSLAGFNAFDPSLEEASSSLGASGYRTFRKVILPFVIPSVLSGAMLVFINSVGEFVSTILLYTYSTKTISVEIYSQLRLYNTGAAAAYGIILFIMVMIIVYISRKSVDKSVSI